jgi:outer membrane protein assembly factor BamA
MEFLIPSKVNLRGIFFTILFVFNFMPGTAQSVKLNVNLEDTTNISDDIKSKLERTYNDSIELESELKSTIVQLREQGYLTVSFDDLEFHKNEASVSFYSGSKFQWGSFNVTSLPENFNLNRPLRKNRPVNLTSFIAYQNKIRSYLENRGYPFARLQFNNVSFRGDTVYGDLKIKPGMQYNIDTIYIKGKSSVHKSYLYPRLGVFPGMLYDASVLSSVSSKVHKIPFLEEAKPPEIDFSENQRANLYVYLNNAQTNRLSGMVGFLSNEDQSFRLTGSVNLLLRNAFSRGERIHLQWESFEEKTQQLDLEFSYPYLFFKRIGMNLEGSLLKQDTSYLTTNFRTSFPFHLTSANTFELYWRYQGSSVISKSKTDESSFQDFRKSLYGVGYTRNTLDYELNPSSGMYLKTHSSLGNKIRESARSVHLETELQISFYKSLFGSFVLKPSLYTAYMKSWSGNNSSPNLSKNELYRIGGNELLRGFQERRFYASLYSVASLEIRYILGTNSNVHIFFDGGYYKNSTLKRIHEDVPMGIGLGANLDTGRGIISLSYALGKTSEEPFEIRNAMVHVGYVNKF